MLPSSEESPDSPWKSFDEAKAAYDAIVPSLTTEADLQELGYDPFDTANIRVLSYVEITERFLPRESSDPQSLDPSLLACIRARERCRAYEAAPEFISNVRTGNVFLDVFGFKRRTRTSGWRFSAIIVLKDNIVQYKIWDGTPEIEKEKTVTKPLGPLQEIDEVIQPRPVVIP